MEFCGLSEISHNAGQGILQNRCMVDVFYAVPHAFFLVFSIATILVLKFCVIDKHHLKTVHFQGHDVRWLATLVLIVVNLIEIAEGLVSDYYDPEDAKFHAFLPQFVACLGSIASIIYYHNVESWNCPQFLLFTFAYYLGAGLLTLLKFVSLQKNDYDVQHLKFWLTLIDVVVYVILVAVEINVIRVQKYICFKKSYAVQPTEEAEQTKYKHAYVNFLSRISFWWMNDILIEGFKRPMHLGSLAKLPVSEESSTQYKKLSQAFEEEKSKCSGTDKQPSLHKIYLKAFWPLLLLAALFRLIGDLLAFVGPWSIERIIDYAYENRGNDAGTEGDLYATSSNMSGNITVPVGENEPSSYLVTVDGFLSNGYSLCGLLFISTIIQHTFLQYQHFLVIREGIRLRSALQSMIYNKALNLSSLTFTGGKTTIGKIMMHMTMDTSFLMMLFFFIHYVWATPVQIIIALTMMYFKLGISAVIGGLIIVVAAPVQVVVGNGMSKMQKMVMQQADKRVKRCNEMVQGIKVIKLLAWERFFNKSITEARKAELKYLLMNAIYRSLFTLMGTALPALGVMITFALYPVLEDSPLTAGKALATLALFYVLSAPMYMFTLFTTSVIMATVSAKRLMPFFLLDEVEGSHWRSAIESKNLDAELETENLKLETFSNGVNCKYRPNSLGSSLSRHSSQESLVDLVRDSEKHQSNNIQPSANVAPGESQAQSKFFHDEHELKNLPVEPSNEVKDSPVEPKPVVAITSGDFSWKIDSKELCLKNIDVRIPTGKLTIIVGSVGSGKSSLLSAMLGEMMTVSGSVEWSRGVNLAYVSQKPWLLHASLKDNVLFGSSFVWKRYNQVIEACALQPDIAILPAGDSTEIGEKGINLSGGQKQRVNIARALYSHADTVIMDDPLSSLDAHTGKHVFDEVILRHLVKRKHTVILVTHQLQYLSHADNVIVMKEGGVQFQGKLDDVKTADPELFESWRKALSELRENTPEPDAAGSQVTQTQDKRSKESTIPPDHQHKPAGANSEKMMHGVPNHDHGHGHGHSHGHGFSSHGHGSKPPGDGGAKGDKDKEAKGKLIKKEHRETGVVKMKVYLCHLRACGIFLCLAVFALLLVSHGLQIASNYWVTEWSSAASKFAMSQRNGGNSNITQVFDNTSYRDIYIAISVSCLVAMVIAAFSLYFTGVKGSKTLHQNMLNTILHVPMRFFDTNPSGRIINRFSSDMGQIDQKVPGTWDSLLKCTLLTLSALVVNSINTPYFLLAAIPLIILYYCMQRFYRASVRELQRIDSITKSPIFSHFSETLSGLQTIRAYRAQDRFQKKAFEKINDNVKPYLFTQTANRWLGIRLDYLGAVLVFAAAISSLVSGLTGSTDPAFIGLSISYALMVSNYLNWIVRNSSELEMMMNAVERVDEYIKLSTEEESHAQGKISVEDSWPARGEIEFRNISLSYDAKLDAVVTDLSFKINSGEKIGVCGRTGSGKTSLTLSLFRMIDITNGEILIDGKDICRMKLHDVRSRLAIIPQDPVLFTGTIRYNLDPTSEVADDRLWEAIESVQLKETIEALPEQLDATVSEGGDNFSVGQRQLFCLARAFLRNNKVLVLDEATASIDIETDKKLQVVIETVFKDKTVITIAHRISTIMKYDRVMVMDGGKMVEFDSPRRLMDVQNSQFANLVKEASKASKSS